VAVFQTGKVQVQLQSQCEEMWSMGLGSIGGIETVKNSIQLFQIILICLGVSKPQVSAVSSFGVDQDTGVL
jgi:hypothetical protein